MNILVAIDSFKGSATSEEMNLAIADGIKEIDAQTTIQSYSVADGGEGTLAAFYENRRGECLTIDTIDLFQRRITAKYVLVDSHTVVVEVAEAAGIHQLDTHLDTKNASSYGFGKMILAILKKHPLVDKCIVGLGGSGINDAGIGMMQAFGVSFKNKNNKEIVPGVSEIADILTISTHDLDTSILKIEFILLSDVSNPLTGPTGATHMFGNQKGVADLVTIDLAIAHYARIVCESTGTNYALLPSTGASGGIGFSFVSFLNSHFVSGANFIIDMLHLSEHIQSADFVITGEGKMDAQSAYGKLPTVIAKLAKSQHKKVIAVVGDASEVNTANYESGFDLILNLTRGPMSLNDSMRQTQRLAKETGRDIMRIVHLAK
ncbi:glycerate kinase [Enterococcus sp. N342-3-1-2]